MTTEFQELPTIEEEEKPAEADVLPSKSRASSVGLSITEEKIRRMKDGPRAWLVCICSFLVQVWVIGILHAYGVFYLAFIEEFKCEPSVAGK